LNQLTKRVLGTALEEMADHLGYDKHDRWQTPATVSMIGVVEIDVPHDTDASCTPADREVALAPPCCR